MKRSFFAVGLFVAAITTTNAMASDVAPTAVVLNVQPNTPIWTGDTVTIDASGLVPGQFMLLFFSPTLGNIDLGIAQLGLGMPLAMQFMGFATSTSFHAQEVLPPMPQVLGGMTFHTQLMAAGISLGFPIEITVSVSNLDAISFASN
ncbi:MAG: hypothetical protein U1E76_11050 [Planctomycetota bacterium]